MVSHKNILVVTTPTLEGLKISRYLQPVSAHIVAGTNIFSDLAADFSDFFGGRSHTYQRQLDSFYQEAMARIKRAAYELGANAVIGLSIDMDEISGKNKSMFMLTAVGTAVIIAEESAEHLRLPRQEGKLKNVSVDRMAALRKKKELLKSAQNNGLELTKEVWTYITEYQVEEIFPYLLKTYKTLLEEAIINADAAEKFYEYLVAYVDALPESEKTSLLYTCAAVKNEKIAIKFARMTKDLQLLDVDKTKELITDDNFPTKKIGMQIATYDKPFYNKQDLAAIQSLRSLIEETFPELGVRTTKKQLLSSKEKEVWNCACGKTNEIDSYCSGCKQDIFGFRDHEINPPAAIRSLDQKIELIAELIA